MENASSIPFILSVDNWDEIKNFRSTPEKKVESTVYVIDQYIPKKAAAVEVCKEIKQTKTLAIATIISVFFVAIGSALNLWAGAAMAGVFTIFSAIYIKRSMNKQKYFLDEYGIGK